MWRDSDWTLAGVRAAAVVGLAITPLAEDERLRFIARRVSFMADREIGLLGAKDLEWIGVRRAPRRQKARQHRSGSD